MGWEPTTTYVTDLNGRLESSTIEPEWDETERAWMLARAAYRRENICALCGMPKEICRSRDTEGRVSVDFERCHVTAELARKQAAHRKEEIAVPESLAYTAAVLRR
jgi:hypothetical protein